MTPEPTRGRLGGLLAVASVAVLVVAGVLLALVLAGGGSDDPAGTDSAGAGVLPTAPASVAATTVRATVQTHPAAAGVWPVGATGFTVVLATLAKADHPRAAAERRARAVQVPGLAARVLDSSQHPRLRPDIWIVYVGRYSTRARAQRVAGQLAAAGVERGIVERLTG